MRLPRSSSHPHPHRRPPLLLLVHHDREVLPRRVQQPSLLVPLLLLLLRAKLPRKPGKRTVTRKELRIRPALGDAPVNDGADIVDLREEVQRVRDEHARLARLRVQEHVLEHVLADVRVERGDGVVEDLDVRADVDRAADVDALLLAAGKRDSLT